MPAVEKRSPPASRAGVLQRCSRRERKGTSAVFGPEGSWLGMLKCPDERRVHGSYVSSPKLEEGIRSRQGANQYEIFGCNGCIHGAKINGSNPGLGCDVLALL